MKQTRQARAAEIGCTMQTLSNWSRSGTDVFDDDAVRDRIRKCRHLPHGLKPEWVPKPAAPVADVDPVQSGDHTERLIHELSITTNERDAKRLKVQIDGLHKGFALREAAGSYVARSTVDEALMRIAAAVKSAILRMESDLPPVLEGMSPPKMQVVIRGKVDEVMLMIADASSKVWEKVDS
jgi:hypothetical protein